FLDIVNCTVLPVDDFSCNLLTIELENKQEICKVHNVGIQSLSQDYYFKFNFTVEQVLKQIHSKIIYCLPDSFNKRYWQNRVDKFTRKGYTIIGRIPTKNSYK